MEAFVEEHGAKLVIAIAAAAAAFLLKLGRDFVVDKSRQCADRRRLYPPRRRGVGPSRHTAGRVEPEEAPADRETAHPHQEHPAGGARARRRAVHVLHPLFPARQSHRCRGSRFPRLPGQSDDRRGGEVRAERSNHPRARRGLPERVRAAAIRREKKGPPLVHIQPAGRRGLRRRTGSPERP